MTSELNRNPGFRYYYGTQRVHGQIRYTADCSGACVGSDALKATWHTSLTEARKTAAERGTLMGV